MSSYKSIYGAEQDITGTQYIAELIISRQSKFLKVKLPDRFWSNSSYVDWKKKYLNQKRKADAMVRAGFSEKAIIRALNSYQGLYVASLFNKKIDSLIEEEQRKLEFEAATQTGDNIEVADPNVMAAPTVNKKTKFSKLRD